MNLDGRLQAFKNIRHCAVFIIGHASNFLSHGLHISPVVRLKRRQRGHLSPMAGNHIAATRGSSRSGRSASCAAGGNLSPMTMHTPSMPLVLHIAAMSGLRANSPAVVGSSVYSIMLLSSCSVTRPRRRCSSPANSAARLAKRMTAPHSLILVIVPSPISGRLRVR